MANVRAFRGSFIWLRVVIARGCSGMEGKLYHVLGREVMSYGQMDNGIGLIAVNICARWVASTFCWHMLDLEEDIAEVIFIVSG